ncbi:MAG: threonylcarbamoyl-AMP synthase [Rhodobacteraceae bacterium]|nr:MAG: threonylcarbamoyl-AMP synthase [Paracoccaceae bacterium]
MTGSAKQTRRLAADAEGIGKAAEILASGGLVAFPTETVYGLGADARDGEAVARIFAAKGRPSFNPLIVHVADLATAERYGVFNRTARTLVKDGWPSALSLVVPLREGSGLSPLVTAGQPSVAIRVPGSDLALKLLRAFGGPVAAPSANPSGRISPTTADHVLSGLGGAIDAVIDGGPTPDGLESTIIGCLDDQPVLLREGGYLPQERDIRRETHAADDPVAPGQLASHYAPNATLRLDAVDARPGEFLLGFGAVAGDLSLSPSGDLIEAAANLYAMLHECDARGVERLAVAPIPDSGIGRAINDRLARAAAPRG